MQSARIDDVGESRTAGAMLTAICLPCFIVSRSPRLSTQASTLNDFEPQRLPSRLDGTGGSITIAMVAATAFAARALRSKIIRYGRKQRPQAVKGFRSIKDKMAENWDEEILNREVVRNYIYGQRGTSLRAGEVAHWIQYRGGWMREEVSNHGCFKPALQRLFQGDGRNRSMMCTGLYQVAGSSAGELDECFRFLEFELGGLSFLTKALLP
eukprot:Skav223897  [mRNA]  locus=scaffold2113:33305:42016:+ [translate_table: standard]